MWGGGEGGDEKIKLNSLLLAAGVVHSTVVGVCFQELYYLIPTVTASVPARQPHLQAGAS